MNEAISTARPNISNMHQESSQQRFRQIKLELLMDLAEKLFRKMQKDFCVDINIEEDGTVSIAVKMQPWQSS